MALPGQVLKSRGKLKSTPTVNECSPSIGRTCPDTETSGPLIGQLFPEWTCSVAASPVRISALPGNEQGLTGNGQGSGVNTSEPFAHFDPDTSSWRTFQVCLLTRTWDVFSETWPRAGTMRNGIVCRRVPLVPLTGEIGSGLWPTPSLSDSKNNGNPSRMTRGGSWGGCELNTVVGGALNPNWVEWLMGYPIGWTDLED